MAKHKRTRSTERRGFGKLGRGGKDNDSSNNRRAEKLSSGDRKELDDPAVLKKHALRDLDRSGLDKSDFRKLQLEVLTADETDEFVGEPRPSYRIPYFDMDGHVTAYSRVRFLTDRKNKAFATKNGKSREGNFRYSQPFNSSPHVYMPPYFNWRKIARNADQKILITEGEKKAATACKAGIPCIALGGVYGFKSQKRGYDLIPELQEFEWNGREVEVCYDADVMMKSEVRQALASLAMTLTQAYSLKTLTFVTLNAETAGPKTGLDDYLKSEGVEGFDKLPREEYRAGARIAMLNTRICFVKAKQRFFDIETGKYFTSLGHLREAYMNEGEEVTDGTHKSLVIDLWAKSASRHTVGDVLYVPGKDEEESKVENLLNLWKPSPIQPKKGSPKRWLELVHFILRKPEYVDWFMKWLAYPIQHTGTKMFQAPFVYGKKQGIGKTFIVDPVMEFIYGPTNFKRLKNTALSSRWNSFAGTKQFVCTNEIYLPEFMDRRSAMGVLKDTITSETVDVDEKFQPIQTFVDYCNYYLTSNHNDALVLEPDDRRFFVIEAPDEKLDQSEYKWLDEYVRSDTGAGNILHYLQGVDTSDFEPKGDAMMTKWKKEIIGLSRDPLAEFAERVFEDTEALLMVNGNLPDLQLFRAEDILRVFEHTYPKYRFNVTISRIGRILDDPRVEKRRVRVSANSPLLSLYALFKREKWGGRRNSEWADHYTTNSRLFGGKSRH